MGESYPALVGGRFWQQGGRATSSVGKCIETKKKLDTEKEQERDFNTEGTILMNSNCAIVVENINLINIFLKFVVQSI
jgi:hypothetical protein